ncbi:MAG: NUDIX domain-containing protein [Verrucomicrobia bacterium]|nr:NUDIX domain-containing protein [Verrucomicrobiota bacterium]
MTEFRLPLDSGGRHQLAFGRERDGSIRARLEGPSAERRTSLQLALRDQLGLRADGQRYELQGDEGLCRLPAATQEIAVELGGARETPTVLARIRPQPEFALAGPPDVLSPLEARYLAETGTPLEGPGGGEPLYAPLTDLHTHFAGCLGAETLVELGRAAGLSYPVELLASIGLRASAAGGEVPLADFPTAWTERLVERLQIPLDRRIPFVELQRIYLLRSPLTKDLRTFVPQCRRIAEDYRRMGVRYAELSLANVVESARLELIHRELPAIEEATGVQLRFLAGIGRQNDYEWDLDLIARLQSLAGSLYVVGVDFMGQEVNSTRAFARQIGLLAQWAHRERPGYVIRVHAGENPAHPENVRVAVEAVGECDVTLRIGHGLYGTDDATLARLAELQVIVEFNLNSNFALNNLQHASAAPIARYVERGVPVVLGTDGCGIYQTTPQLEARAAQLAGLEAAGFARIRQTELAYLERRTRLEAPLRGGVANYRVPPEPAPVHYSAEVSARLQRLAQAETEALQARLAGQGIPLLDERAVARLLRERRCVAFAGAWQHSWAKVPPARQREVEAELELLLRALAAERALLITGGTQLGVEGVLSRLARRIGGLEILGVLVRQTPVDALEAGGMQYAHLVAEELHQKSAALYRLLRAHDVPTVFVGGGQIVSDEIQTARNLRLRYALMAEVPGASSEHAAHRPERAFRTHAEALQLLQRPPRTPGALFHPGANPTADAVVFRRVSETGEWEILLIQRDVDAEAEGGRWALPGGFVRSAGGRDEPFDGRRETPRAACLRELYEETGLALELLADHLRPVGEFVGGGRDPRDTPERWIHSHAFTLLVPEEVASTALLGSSDASDAAWFPLDPLPVKLAFDHERIVAEARRLLAGETAAP